MKVPDIYDLVSSELKSIKEKEERLEKLKQDSLNYYICLSLEKEIKYSKRMIEKFRQEMRNDKLKKLGI
jgi:hypothetical protein